MVLVIDRRRAIDANGVAFPSRSTTDAGSGSVAVGAARLGAAAVAIERNATQCARIRANAARHDVPVDIIEGEARRVVVVALRTLERVGPLLRALDEAGWQTDGMLLSAARIAPLPTGHRLTAAQPVFVVRGRRDAAPGLAHAVTDHRWTP